MENKTSKYLKYAIGEVVLVVIGILIALQINNWNEERKLRKFELNLLYELIDVLENGEVKVKEGEFSGDLGFQKTQIENNKGTLASCEYLINHFTANLPYTDSLNYHFANAHTRYISLAKDQAYQNVKNYGLGFIKNDSLKVQLIQTYETNTNWLLELNERNNLYENNFVIPLLTELFDNVNMESTSRIEKSMIPNDYESLKTNKKYLNVLKTTMNKRKEYLVFLERRYQRMLSIHKLLKKEIESKTN